MSMLMRKAIRSTVAVYCNWHIGIMYTQQIMMMTELVSLGNWCETIVSVPRLMT